MRVHWIGSAKRLALVCLLAAAAACSTLDETGAPAPARPADAARGLTYARAHCATCHAVAPGDQKSPIPTAPPFETVANMTGMSNIVLNVWLRSAHPTMPEIAVPDRDVGDLSAYLQSLKDE